jgi:hypothetical protein
MLDDYFPDVVTKEFGEPQVSAWTFANGVRAASNSPTSPWNVPFNPIFPILPAPYSVNQSASR